MSLQPPSESRVKTLLVRQLRLHGLSSRPEAAEMVYNYLMNFLADLYDRGTIGDDVNIHVDHQIRLIVDTTIEITKDKKNVEFVDDSLMTQVISILSQYHQNQYNQQLKQSHNLDHPSLEPKPSTMASGDVELAIKYATLQRIQPIHILDSFNTPKFTFSLHQNQYIPDSLQLYPNPGSTKDQPLRQLNNNKKLHSDPAAYISMFTHRYFSIFQRTLRQERSAQQQRQLDHASSKVSTKTKSKGISQADATSIYQVDSLRGSTGDLTVFGYLNEIIGQVFLESPSAQILVDLSNALLVDPDALFDQNQNSSQQSRGDGATSYTSNNLISQAVAQHFSSQPTPAKQPRRPRISEIRATPLKNTSKEISSSSSTQQQTHEERIIIQQHSVFSKLFTVGCFVLLTGCVYETGNVFIAKRIQLPHHEPRQHTLSLYPSLQIIPPHIDYISNPLQHYTYKQGKQLLIQTQQLANLQPQMITLASSSTNTDTLAFIKNQTLLLESLQDPSQNHFNERLYILGEVYLHDPLTMQKLHTFFHLCNEDPPTFIVFTGNYMSPQYYQQHRYNPYLVKSLFDKLGDLIFTFKNLRTQTHFIFAPGSHDFIHGSTLPLPPIQPSFVGRLVKNITTLTFTSNPINLRYYGRDIKIFRHDIFHTIASRDTSLFELSKCVPDSLLPIEFQQQKQNLLRKEAAKAKHHTEQQPQFPAFNDDNDVTLLAVTETGNLNDDGDFELPDIFSLSHHDVSALDEGRLDKEIDEELEYGRFMGDIVVKHLTSQDSLIPDLHLKPILWDYAQALSLVALPDVLFLIDTPIPYNIHKHGSIFYNVGIFTGKWGFAAYCPATNTIQPAIVP